MPSYLMGMSCHKVRKEYWPQDPVSNATPVHGGQRNSHASRGHVMVLICGVRGPFRDPLCPSALPFWELSQDSLRKWEKGKLISIFSVKVSCKKLMAPSTEVAKPTDHLNGMRVISMFWIILGHSFLMAAGISGCAPSPVRTKV